MRRTGTLLIAAALFTAPLAGCGENKLERGLTVGQEEAVPDDPQEDRMTEAERRKQSREELAAEEQQRFDAAEGAAGAEAGD